MTWPIEGPRTTCEADGCDGCEKCPPRVGTTDEKPLVDDILIRDITRAVRAWNEADGKGLLVQMKHALQADRAARRSAPVSPPDAPNVYGLLSSAVKRASDVLDYHGCISGDCSHEGWADCESALIGDVSRAILADPAYTVALVKSYAPVSPPATLAQQQLAEIVQAYQEWAESPSAPDFDTVSDDFGRLCLLIQDAAPSAFPDILPAKPAAPSEVEGPDELEAIFGQRPSHDCAREEIRRLTDRLTEAEQTIEDYKANTVSVLDWCAACDERDDARRMFEGAEHARAVLASRLAQSRQAIEQLERYEPSVGAWLSDPQPGMASSLDGDYLERDDVLACLSVNSPENPASPTPENTTNG